MMVDLQPSLALVEPPDMGGRISRTGYHYQDLCTLRHCIRAAKDGSWEEIWCESHDDIVLYSRIDGREHYRFLQVKYKSTAEQHWSVALLFEHTPRQTVADS